MTLLPFRRRTTGISSPAVVVPLPEPNPHLVAAIRTWLATDKTADPDKALADCLTRLDFYGRHFPELVPQVAAEYAALTAALESTEVAA